MYVTKDYYTDEYAGIEINADKLNNFIKRAERDIDRLARFRIVEFDSMPEWKQKAIKNAVCAQVEFIAENGETASSISSSGGSFSIGSYSESSGNSNEIAKTQLYADSVYDYLFPTGLMYAGVDRYV